MSDSEVRVVKRRAIKPERAFATTRKKALNETNAKNPTRK